VELTLAEDSLDAIDEWLLWARDDEGDLGASISDEEEDVASLTSWSTANLTRAVKLSAAIWIFLIFGSLAVPALPGAAYTAATDVDLASFQLKACSRPPLPMMRIFM
jgi:hypothetical protein